MSKLSFCRTVRFRAAHHYQVKGWRKEQNVAAFGDAALPHEHDWALTCWFTGPLDQNGMIADLIYIDRVLAEEVRDRFHGKHINQEEPWFRQTQPTTEALASWFATRLAPRFPKVILSKIRVAEEEDLFAEWEA